MRNRSRRRSSVERKAVEASYPSDFPLFVKQRVAFVPPKPKLFVSTTSTVLSWALPET